MTTSELTIKTSQRMLARPYEGVDSLSAALELTILVIDGTTFAQGNVNLPSDLLPLSSGQLEMFLDVDGVLEVIQPLGIDAKDLSVACVATGSVIAASCTLFDEAFVDCTFPRTVELQGDPLVFDSPNGFDLRVVLYLKSDLRPRGFRPHRSGTWLAVAAFSVSPSTSLSRFCPVPMDDVIRSRYGLPKGCMSYVEVGDNVLSADALEDEVEVFVDLSILRLLQGNPEEPLATYVQLDLVSETLCSILTRAAEQVSEYGEFNTVEDMQSAKRPIARIFVEVAKSGGVDPNELLAAAVRNPGLLRSCVEAHIGMLKTTSRALRDVS